MTPTTVSGSHPRVLGWPGATALAMGGSNQSLFLIGALVLAQGSAAVPLLIVGLVLSWAATPGWIELILMWPNRVGGIAATCAEAFRPYNPVLANLTGVSYWWGWVPTCGLTAILSASALHEWYLPWAPVPALAVTIVVAFCAVNLLSVRAASRVALPIACLSALLALASAVVPVVAGNVDWHQATSFHLSVPFDGAFGAVTSAMAGLYLIGFAAPAFEAATCHVGEMKDPARSVPRAVYAAAIMASLYFVVLPVVWLGALGTGPIGGELMKTLGPAYAPLLAGAAKAAAIWFMVLNMFHGTLQPLAGAARTLAQLAEDGLLPRLLGRRNRRDVPWVATTLTAAMAIAFLLAGDPVWMIAGANFCYLIGIAMPSVAVWLLRRNEPDRERPYRAPRGTITLGLWAAAAWLLSTVLGFEQFGLPTVLFSLGLGYSGAALFAWRRRDDRRRAGIPGLRRSLHFKLTGAMVAVMALDGAGYLLAVGHVDAQRTELVTVLSDIFVAVAILTIAVGLVLPGMISHAAEQVADAAGRLARGTVTDLTRAMQALARGDLDEAHAREVAVPVLVRSQDEMRAMADGYNALQAEVGQAARALDVAREGLRATEAKLERNVEQQAAVARLGRRALEAAPLDDLFDEVTDVVRAVLGVDSAGVFELEHDGTGARVRASRGLSADRHARVSSRGLEPLLHTGWPIVVEDVADADAGIVPDLLAPAGMRSGVGVQVPGNEGVFGLLTVQSVAPRRFPPDELDFLQAIAHVLADAIERERAEQRMRHGALHDPLTGLPNRTLFADRLDLALARARRGGMAVSVLFLDFDHFKLVNDSLGHSAGDELLRGVAARLDETLRMGDTVARFGGDEFVIICEGLEGADEAVEIAERTQRALARPFAVGGAEHFVTASIGIAVSDGSGQRAEDLLREADAAMYRAKERGRACSELFDERMRDRATARLRTENELRRALEHDELRLVYQPIVELATGRMTGVEALVRWQHPTRGLLGPMEFVPVAEDTGLIVPLGEWVFREACRQSAEWRAARSDAAPVRVSINLAARQVAQPGLLRRLGEIIAETGADPALLGVEITETTLMDETGAAVETLQRLKDLGLKVLLDDFGTGYSSLAYVKRFPIDVLKIDRSFTADLDRDDADTATIVEAIVNMARGLRVGVVAEGVETEQHAARLRELGCTSAQGYLFARPMSAADVAERFDAPLLPAAS